MILLSEARENTAAEAPETTENAMTIAAQSAATCVGDRIGGHFAGNLPDPASPKWGISALKLPQNANF
jgi:hypothetical protein